MPVNRRLVLQASRIGREYRRVDAGFEQIGKDQVQGIL